MAVYSNNYTTWYHNWYKEKELLNRKSSPVSKSRIKNKFSDDTTSFKKKEKCDRDNEIIWIMNPCNTDDVRPSFPVPRYKIYYPNPLQKLDQSFQLAENRLLPQWGKKYATPFCPSSHSSRSEDWSVLRAMLPSKGISVKKSSPNWGTGSGSPPKFVRRKVSYFPRVESAMSKFTEKAHQNDRLFRLY